MINWVKGFMAIVSLFATALIVYIQFIDSRQVKEITIASYKEPGLFDKLDSAGFDKKFQEAIALRLNSLSVEKAADISLNKRFDDLEAQIRNVSDQTTAVRQAINPTNPNEIVTIARLTDKVVNLEQDLSRLNDDIRHREKSFKESIVREISSSNNSTNLMLVVLIPLVLNFLFSLWKEFRSSNGV